MSCFGAGGGGRWLVGGVPAPWVLLLPVWGGGGGCAPFSPLPLPGTTGGVGDILQLVVVNVPLVDVRDIWQMWSNIAHANGEWRACIEMDAYAAQKPAMMMSGWLPPYRTLSPRSPAATGGRPGPVLVCDTPQPPPPPPPPRVLRDSGLGTWRQRRPPFFRMAPTAPPFLV